MLVIGNYPNLMVKKIIVTTLSILNRNWLRIKCGKQNALSGFFLKANILAGTGNNINITNSEVIKSLLSVSGEKNVVESQDSVISNCLISISGNDNKLVIGRNVKLRGANIIIRGDHCKVTIGDRTTFEGIRIVNVGLNNVVSIGRDCMFSDKIELWASDTHSIFDNTGEWINQEKPVIIGDKVWVGSGVTILKGVIVGDGSIVGMGSLVTKNIPDKVISVGVPNKIIKENISWNVTYRGRNIQQV